MDHVGNRCVIASAAALVAGGLIVGLAPTMLDSLPDVQVRDFDLSSATITVNPGAVADIIENHVRPDAVGAGDPQLSLSDVLFGRGDDALGGLNGSAPNLGDLALDEDAVKSLLGGGLDPETLQGLISGPVIDAGAPNVGASGAFSAGDPSSVTSAASAASVAATSAIAAAVQGLTAAQQVFTSGVAQVELQLNEALVQAQLSAAQQLSGDNPELNSVISAIFNANNTVLAHDEAALNSILGVSLGGQDLQNSLLSSFDVDAASAQADWGNFMQTFSPGDLEDLIRVVQADYLIPALNDVDWGGIFAGLF